MTTETDGFAPDQPDIPVKRRFRMTPKRWLVAGLALVLLTGAGVGTFLLLRPSQAAGASTFSRTVQAEVGTQTLTVSLDGTLSPRKQSDVDFGVSGTVTKVYVKTGDVVTKGEKLARIDDEALQNAVDLAEANVTTAGANLDEVYDNDGSSAAITSAKAQVRSANAALTSAKQDLEDAVLRSPIAGTVASVDLEVGDTVGSSSSSGSSGGSASASSSSSTSSSSAQFVIIATAKWKLEGSIGAADLGSVKAGQKVAVTTDATTDELTGTVASVGIVATSTSDDGTATFPVVVNLSGTHTDLYSGTTASAVITTGSYDDVLTVPTAAIRSEDGKTVVTTVTNGSNTTTEVEVGKVFGNYTEVTSGLAEGDSVLITFTRPTSTSTASSQEQGGGFGMGFGGIDGGGGPPAGGGGAPPGGQGGR